MTRGIFIAGNESTLIKAVEAEAEKRIEQFASAVISNRISDVLKTSESDNENEKRISLEWNPSSPISARTLVLAAENRLEHIDDAILVCSPPLIRSTPSGLPLPVIEMMINDHVKGWFFLVKELTAVFKARGRGTLALVYPDFNTASGKDEAAEILGSSALASFRALTQGLLSSAHNDTYFTAGFSTTDAGNESAFAAYIFKNIDELNKKSNGKLFKYGKFNFFK
ncbi:MAG: hypothetical protein FWB73_03345 [Treponema sp.]|nr:hypothetical protein [Treponema sp.]